MFTENTEKNQKQNPSQMLFADLKIRKKIAIDLDGMDHKPVYFVSFANLPIEDEHFAIVFGYPSKVDEPVVRVHSECITGDLFRSKRCDCGAQLSEFLEIMKSCDGVLLYLRQEGRGIGLYAKLDAYELQDLGQDTFEANKSLNFPEDGRDFTIAGQMLKLLEIRRFALVTNNPDKITALKDAGLDVAKVQQTGTHITKQNRRYLMAKRRKGHLLQKI